MEYTLYDFLQLQENDTGCTNCPFINECDQGDGYTMMDEHGECPIKDINTQQDIDNAIFPEIT